MAIRLRRPRPDGWLVYGIPAKGDLRIDYIGETDDLERRIAEHKRTSWWRDEVDFDRVVILDRKLPTKTAARVREAELIRTVRPRFNDRHNRANPRRQPRPAAPPRRPVAARRWEPAGLTVPVGAWVALFAGSWWAMAEHVHGPAAPAGLATFVVGMALRRRG